VRPHADVGLLRPADRLDHTGGVAQQRAELGRRGIVEVRDRQDVVARCDDQRAEVEPADGVVDDPARGLVDDAARHVAPTGGDLAA
jgi:hypothetical protein